MKFNFENQLFTEENFMKILKGFNFYSNQIDEEIIKGPYFDQFI